VAVTGSGVLWVVELKRDSCGPPVNLEQEFSIRVTSGTPDCPRLHLSQNRLMGLTCSIPFDPLVQPAYDGFMPLNAVLGLEYPMVFIREIEKLAWYSLTL